MLSKHFEELKGMSKEALMASEEEVYEYTFECIQPVTGSTTVSKDFITNPAKAIEDMERSKIVFPKQGCSYEVELYFDPRIEPPLRVGESKGIFSAVLTDAGGNVFWHAQYLERLK